MTGTANPAVIYRMDSTSINNNWYEGADTLADPYDNHQNENISPPGSDDRDPAATGTAAYNTRIFGGGLGGVFGYTDVPAYALVSHGQNSFGAFTGRTSTSRVPGAGTLEAENADGDLVLRDVDRSERNLNEYYDDTVFWQTQSDLLSRLREDSCIEP